jgi:hypothetical protein
MVTFEQAQAELSYDPTTGILTRLRNGKAISSTNNTIRVAGKYEQQKNMAYLLHYKAWPECKLFYINGDHSDHRIDNIGRIGRILNH